MEISDDTRTSERPATGPAANVHEIMGPRMMRKSPVLEEAWRYWNSLRQGGALPRRADLNPASMKLILGHALILDRVRPGTVRVRLGGRVANDLMGMETRGLPIRAFFDLLQRSRAIDLVEQVFTEVATLEMDLISEGVEGSIAARMVILPLADASGAASKALAVLVPDRLVVEGPRRFSILRHHVGLLVGAKPVAPVDPVPAPRAANPPVPAERVTGQQVTGARDRTDLRAGRTPQQTTYAPAPPSLPVRAAEPPQHVFAETQVPWLRVVK